MGVIEPGRVDREQATAHRADAQSIMGDRKRCCPIRRGRVRAKLGKDGFSYCAIRRKTAIFRKENSFGFAEAESCATAAGSSRSTYRRNGKKMKKTKWILVTILVLGAGALGGAGCNTSSEQRQGTNRMEQAAQYTCPMHPEVVQSTPGKCPKCGMDLVEKR